MFASLIIPCIVAGAAVFVSSAVIWMAVRWHDRGIQQIFDEQFLHRCHEGARFATKPLYVTALWWTARCTQVPRVQREVV